jgi:hypothetical protein
MNDKGFLPMGKFSIFWGNFSFFWEIFFWGTFLIYRKTPFLVPGVDQFSNSNSFVLDQPVP